MVNRVSALMKQKMSAITVACSMAYGHSHVLSNYVFPFTGKPGKNVDLENPSNPLEYFEPFCTPGIVEAIARETNGYAQKFLENTPNIKLRSRAHHWKERNRNEIMKLLAFFLLQGLHRNPDNKSCFSHRKILETPIFLDLFSERSQLLLKFLHFVRQ